MQTEQAILTRGLPKTGQETSYRAGDDGVHEAGWWKGVLYGANRTRFIAKTIGGDDVVIDLATGLMWAADGTAGGCNDGDELNWDDCIDFANALDFAGFTDWRLPNTNELNSIFDYGIGSPGILEPPFANTQGGAYWSSTTYNSIATKAHFADGRYKNIYIADKTDTNYLRCVRGAL